MTMENVPSILIVDDEPERLAHEIVLRLNDNANHKVVHPNRIEMRDLRSVDLVLVDYRLEKWKERDAQSSISLRPSTGLALAVVLREQLDRLNKTSLTAFALHSGHISDIEGRLPRATVQHVLARLNNLEWVFPKASPRRYEQMMLLADAVRRLPRDWPRYPDKAARCVRSLLELRETSWSERCWRDVLECRVPIRELVEGAHGLVFVRWLLHEVMPYPSFLWSLHWVAARLRITIEALNRVRGRDSQLSRDLNEMRYSGILSEFLGPRWWRGALEDYVWEAAGGCSSNEERLRTELSARAGIELQTLDVDPVVVCLDVNLKPTGKFESPMTAVAVRPDHWPAFADAAWMSIDTVRDDSHLQSLLDPFDLQRVETRDR